MDVADIDLAAASARVGDQFRIDVDDGSVIELELELVEAAPSPIGPSGASSNSFSLVFRGPTAPLLNQGILPLQHHAWGLCPLFVVPVDQDEVGTYYEAVFSREA